MKIDKLTEQYAFQSRKYICKNEHSSTYYCKTHTHEFYEFVIVLSKKTAHYINEKKYQLNVGDMFFLQPDETHRFELPLQTPTTFLTLGLKCETFDNYVNVWGNLLKESFNFQNTGLVKLTPSELTEINTVYEQFKLEQGDLKDLLFTMLVNKLFCILLNWTAFRKPYENQTSIDYVLDSMNVPENIAEGIPAMVRLSGLSIRQLSRILKNQYNTTPYKYITDLRMNYGANLLLHTDMSITYIACEVGYSNSNNFTLRFKKKFGMTPKQYRQNPPAKPK